MTYTEGLVTMVGAIVTILGVVVSIIVRATKTFTTMAMRIEQFGRDLVEHTQTEERLRTRGSATTSARIDGLTRSVSKVENELARLTGRIDRARSSGPS